MIDELVDDLRQGRASAGPLLVSVCGPKLHDYARAIAGDLSEGDREQVCERAVERAVRNIAKFDPARGTFLAWLRGFVRHEAGNWRRSYAALEQLDDDAPDETVPPAARVLSDDDRDALRDLVRSLPHADQLIIKLRDVERLPYGEIARHLKASEATCRQRHRRALVRLSERAEKDGRLDHWRGTG